MGEEARGARLLVGLLGPEIPLRIIVVLHPNREIFPG